MHIMADVHQPSFIIELDLVLHFVPPMDEHAPGVVLTRAFDIPFPPYDGLVVYSPTFEDCPTSEGMPLKDIIWDVERKVFLARTYLVHCGLPFAFIPDEIRSWVDNGWRLGSYRDGYGGDVGEDDEQAEESATAEDTNDWSQFDDDELDAWRKLPARKRPPQFNRIMRAVVRMMAETHNNLDVAYAMDKTKRYFTKKEAEDIGDNTVQQWRDATKEFLLMSLDEQVQWQEHVQAHHPRLDRML